MTFLGYCGEKTCAFNIQGKCKNFKIALNEQGSCMGYSPLMMPKFTTETNEINKTNENPIGFGS